MEQVVPADGAQRLVGDGEVALDAHAAEYMAAGRYGPVLPDTVGGLGSYVDLADGAGRVEGVAVGVLVVAGDRGFDGRLQFHGLHHDAGETGLGREQGVAVGEIVEEIGCVCERDQRAK